MIHIRYIVFLSIIFIFCERAPSDERERAILNALAKNVIVTASDGGITDVGREGVWHNVLVRIENRSDHTVWLSSLGGFPLSDYVRKRNKDAICYRVLGRTSTESAWRDASQGLFGDPREKYALSTKSTIEFRAPIRIDSPRIERGAAKIWLFVYADSTAANAKDIYSNEVVFDQ